MRDGQLSAKVVVGQRPCMHLKVPHGMKLEDLLGALGVKLISRVVMGRFVLVILMVTIPIRPRVEVLDEWHES